MTQPPPPDRGWSVLHGGKGLDAAVSTNTIDVMDILDVVETPIVVLHSDFALGRFNKAAREVLGLAPADIGRAPRDIAVLAGLSDLEERCGEVVASGEESRTDLRDGNRWFVVRISPCTNGDPEGKRTVLTFTNVTASRASLDQVIYERECTQAVLDVVADPVVVVGADRRIQLGNRAFYTMFLELASLRTRLDEIVSGAPALQSVEVDHDIPGEGRRTLMLEARPLPLPSHSERRVLVTFRDITARRPAELADDLTAIAQRKEQVWRIGEFLAEAQRLSLTGSFSWRVATDEITWSEQLYRIFEFDQSVPVTLELANTRVHPDDIAMLHDRIETARRVGADFEYETRLQMPDQSTKYLHTTAHARRTQDGQLEYIGAVQDVTQRRLAEEALSKARSELAHVSRITSLGALTASIAHEVNQPLSGIITNASTCLRMLAADPPNVDGARETARRTIRDGRRAADVIQRLRALFSRKDAVVEEVDLNEAAREVIDLSLSDLRRNHVMVQLELADNLPAVSGDRVQLQQVILNLLMNASDAMNEVDDRPREMIIRTERDQGDHVRLTIEDAGVGIERDGTDQLFDAFYTTKSDGMGIGLSVSRSIIESHKGRLWAAPNEHGPGASFAFALPCAAEAVPPPPHRPRRL